MRFSRTKIALLYIITGRIDEEHLERLKEVLQICRDHNINLNLQTCRFFQDSVRFLGHRVDVAGVHKTNEKIQAGLEAKQPTDVTEVKSFLGLVTFYARFIPRLADLAAPLYELTQKRDGFHWKKPQAEAFARIKKEIVSARVLTYYRPDLHAFSVSRR